MRVPSSAKRLLVGSGRNHSRVFIGIAQILQRKLRYISGSNVTRIQDLLENNLMLGKVENKRKRGRQKTGSVSYTHLDVYKRQIPMNTRE